MKLVVKLPLDILSTLRPSPVPSTISLSSKTPGKDFEDRWSLDKFSDVGSFQGSIPAPSSFDWSSILNYLKEIANFRDNEKCKDLSSRNLKPIQLLKSQV